MVYIKVQEEGREKEDMEHSERKPKIQDRLEETEQVGWRESQTKRQKGKEKGNESLKTTKSEWKRNINSDQQNPPLPTKQDCKQKDQVKDKSDIIYACGMGLYEAVQVKSSCLVSWVKKGES